MESEYITEAIGKKIKDLRLKNGLTQQELADRTELTKGFISQLERGQVSPSVVTLLDLIECLGITPAEFFKEAHEEHIVFNSEDYFEKIDENGSSIQWVVPTAQGNQMEPLLVVVAPHSSLEEDEPHSGEEFGFLISGKLLVFLGNKRYEVKAGESFYYKANQSHRIENPSARPAKFVWVSTPPNF